VEAAFLFFKDLCEKQSDASDEYCGIQKLTCLLRINHYFDSTQLLQPCCKRECDHEKQP
jgi:hypothetical protein